MKGNATRLTLNAAFCVSLSGLCCCGCYSLREGHEHFPPGALNQPVGTLTRQWQAAQVDKAQEHGLVLYQAAWVGDSDQLGPAAKGRLAEFCHQESCGEALVTLETSHNQSLDEQRRQAILNFASSHGVSLDPELIAFAAPDSNLLYGEEAVRLSREMMQGNQQNVGLDGFGSGNFNGFPGSGLSSPFGVGR